MKNENNILNVKILNKTVTINYDKGEVFFPPEIKEEEIESFAWYLSEEGFLDKCDIKR